MTGVAKRYGNTRALTGIDLGIQAGQVVGIVGENGAGKSTLVKLLSGAELSTSGTLTVAGEVIDRRDTGAVYERGVRVVYQEGSFVSTLPLLDNLALDELADACAERDAWEFLLTVAPLALSRCTGSPVNPIAVL